MPSDNEILLKFLLILVAIGVIVTHIIATYLDKREARYEMSNRFTKVTENLRPSKFNKPRKYATSYEVTESRDYILLYMKFPDEEISIRFNLDCTEVKRESNGWKRYEFDDVLELIKGYGVCI